MNKFSPLFLEWELLQEPIVLTLIEDRSELPKGKKIIRINRDEEYNLKAILDFEDPKLRGIHSQYADNVAGTLAKTFEIKGYSGGATYVMESAVFGTYHHTMSQYELHERNTAIIHFKALRSNYSNRNEGTHFIEWCLNGPTDLFWEHDEKKELKYFRERTDSNKKIIDSVDICVELTEGGGSFLWIELPDLKFLVTKVPDEFGPKWSSNIGIEYRKEWGGVPDVAKREKIEDICSFIFGRQLLSIGYTIFDQKENLVEGYYHDPWGKNARNYCANVAYPPIKINRPRSVSPKKIISQLIPKYIELSDSLRLTEAIWYIWISREMPIGANLPTLASALESIICGWFKSKSESHGVYLKKEEFVSLIENEIKAIQKKIDLKISPEISTKIVEKMSRANEFGIMERYRIFFEEIGLAIEPHEWNAIKERHKFVHGHTRFKQANWNKVLRHVNTYETLLNKVILKLLGYTGSYIDRSRAGWKDKRLD